jgi:hypothetical protein
MALCHRRLIDSYCYKNIKIKVNFDVNIKCSCHFTSVQDILYFYFLVQLIFKQPLLFVQENIDTLGGEIARLKMEQQNTGQS